MSGAPRTIMIIRHAEKPAETPDPPPPHGVDVEGAAQPHSLTPRGWQRAGALAVLFGGPPPPTPLVRPTVLVSPDYGAETPIHRTTQTITPLAERMGLTPMTPVAKGQEDRLVHNTIMGLAGADVLICWEHHHIGAIASALAAALGVPLDALPALATAWPEEDYASVIVFSATRGGAHAVTVTNEDLLSGDPPRRLCREVVPGTATASGTVFGTTEEVPHGDHRQ